MIIRFVTPVHRFEVQEVLKEGAISSVYLAQRTHKNFKVKQTLVIKLFKQKNSPHFPQQVESLLRVRHSSHLTKVLSFESFYSQPALILEYIHGVSLKQLLQSTELEEKEINSICSQTLKGLQELKKNGLAHGDLSLSNILIDSTGRVFLTDYGLGNYIVDGFYGTEPFCAPELYQNKTAGFYSDLFSLGVLEKVLKGHITEKELNLMKGEHFLLDREPLLHPHPQKRKIKEFSTEFVSSLGQKVQEALSIKEALSYTKSPKLSSVKKESSLKGKSKVFSPQVGFLSGLFLFFLLASNPFVSYETPLPAVKQSSAKILVRTREWTHIQIADISGYAPITVPLYHSGTYKLKWRKQNSSGLKYIHLKGGQKIILKDKDFP